MTYGLLAYPSDTTRDNVFYLPELSASSPFASHVCYLESRQINAETDFSLLLPCDYSDYEFFIVYADVVISMIPKVAYEPDLEGKLSDHFNAMTDFLLKLMLQIKDESIMQTVFASPLPSIGEFNVPLYSGSVCRLYNSLLIHEPGSATTGLKLFCRDMLTELSMIQHAAFRQADIKKSAAYTKLARMVADLNLKLYE